MVQVWNFSNRTWWWFIGEREYTTLEKEIPSPKTLRREPVRSTGLEFQQRCKVAVNKEKGVHDLRKRNPLAKDIEARAGAWCRSGVSAVVHGGGS